MRISVLYRIHDDPEHPFSEAVGVVQSVGAGSSGEGPVLEVLRRDGHLVRVPGRDLVTFKRLNGSLRET